MAIDVAALKQPWVPRDTFSSRLRQVRNELGLKVEEMAATCGFPMPTYNSWERGRRPHKLDEVVRKIVDATGVDRDWLMWGGDVGREGGIPSSRWKTRSTFGDIAGSLCASPDADQLMLFDDGDVVRMWPRSVPDVEVPASAGASVELAPAAAAA